MSGDLLSAFCSTVPYIFSRVKDVNTGELHQSEQSGFDAITTPSSRDKPNKGFYLAPSTCAHGGAWGTGALAFCSHLGTLVERRSILRCALQ